MAPGAGPRAWRAVLLFGICLTVGVGAPATASAGALKKNATAKRHATKVREGRATKPHRIVSAPKPTPMANGLGNTLGVTAANQLAAMRTAIDAAASYFPGRTTGCSNITPMLASQGGSIMAGNFRDSQGYCYIWLNLQQSSMLTGSEICKTTLHEMGHLTGLQHSADPADVMFAPFQSDPIPAPCQAQPATTTALAKVKAKNSSVATASICPPGAQNADYCQTVVASKKATTKRTRSAAKRTRA